MNMTQMNPGVAGGPVGGGMVMMNSGSPAIPGNNGGSSSETIKVLLNTYIYEYFIKLGHYELAKSLLAEKGLEIRTRPPVKPSPGRRKDNEVNGVDGDSMDTDSKDDIPDDLPRPLHAGDGNTPGSGFLYEWFCIFSDLFAAHQKKGGQGGNVGAAAQYLIQHQVPRHFLSLLPSQTALTLIEHATDARKPTKPESRPGPRHDAEPVHACWNGTKRHDEWQRPQRSKDVSSHTMRRTLEHQP